MRQVSHCDDGAGRRRDAVLWQFDSGWRALTSAVHGGGLLTDCRWVVNAEVALDYRRPDPARHAAEIADELGLAPGHGAVLLTAARVAEVTSAQDGGASCDATVGLSVPTWAADEDDAGIVWRPGTINLVCTVPVAWDDSALVNAVMTVTEAKTQALLDRGVPGTGTASDAVVICCRPGGGEPFGGPRSPWGSRLARATYAAVLEGTDRYLARSDPR